MTEHRTIRAGMVGAAWLRKCGNRLPLATVGAAVLVIMLRALGDELAHAFGFQTWGMFFSPEDRYADLVKVALSYKAMFGAIAATPGFQSWPELFRGYFTANPYDTVGLTAYHIPPLPTLMYLAVAKAIVLAGPKAALALFYAIYAGLAALLGRFFVRALALPAAYGWALALLMVVSYPALFMLNRGNLAAGVTAVGLAAYAISGVAGKSRWLGIFCLAVAVNFRPNVAVFALAELAFNRSFWRAFAFMASGGVASLVMLALSYAAAHGIYPAYNIASILHGLALYNTGYVVGVDGVEWGNSLQLIGKAARHALHLTPTYNPVLAGTINALGLVAGAAVIWAMAARKLKTCEALFLLCCLSALFTPVFALYHMMAFSLAVLAAWIGLREAPQDSRTLTVLAFSLAVMCPLGGSISNGLLTATLMSLGFAVVLTGALRTKQA